MSPFPKALELPVGLSEVILDAAIAEHSYQAFRLSHRRGRGATLRPGKATPLWNELRRQLRPHLLKYGEQATLAKVLALPRQRVNAYVTGGSEMPDAVTPSRGRPLRRG